MKKNKKAYRKRRKPSYKYIPLTIAVMTVALIVGLSVFCKIKEIEVAGSSKYTKEEILAAAGIELGGNLIAVDGSSVAAAVTEKLPYIDEVIVAKLWPSTVVIHVEQSVSFAVIGKEGGGYYKLTASGKVQEALPEYPNEGLIEIRGFAAAESAVGKTLEVSQGNELALGYMLEIFSNLTDFERADKVSWIDLTDAGNIKFDYDARFTIELGSGENIADKFTVAFRIAEEIEDGRSGRILVKNTAEASFVPSG